MSSLRKKIIQNLALLSSIILLSFCFYATCTPNTSTKTVQCNSGVYTKQGDPFTISLAYVLEELDNKTPSRQGYDLRNISPYPNAFAYGHAACNQTLVRARADCLGEAKVALLGTCDGRIGARSVLYDCLIRYEQYPFDD